MKDKIEKTNAIRALDEAHINYIVESIDPKDFIDGLQMAKLMGKDPNTSFKTLVTVGKSNNHYVFMVPVSCELDLKKAAKVVNEKNIEMIKTKELLPLTGYIHGGCSPIGMKKMFKTVIDETSILYEEISFSGGKVGLQVTCDPNDLTKVIDIEIADICKDKN